MYNLIFIILVFHAHSSYCLNNNDNGVIGKNDVEPYDLNTVKTIEIASIGRVADLGDLYDARDDQFLGMSLFKSHLSNMSLTSTQNAETMLKYTLENSYEEKFKTLEISAELKLSVLFGLIQLQGSGSFFKDTKTSARSAKASLIDKLSTSYEHISITDTSVSPLINLDVLQKIDATHVVVGIQWGGRVFISVEDSNYDNKDKQTIEGSMRAKIKMLAGLFEVSGQAKVKISEAEKKELNKFDFQIYGDILPDNVPQNLIEAIEFMKKAPGLLQKSNKGKGKAILYKLFPISTLRKLMKLEGMANIILKRVDESTVKDCVKLFDNINLVEQKINDLATDAKSKAAFITKSTLGKIEELQHSYDIYQSEIRKNLSEHLILLRSGNGTADKLQNLIMQASKSPLAWQVIDKKLCEFENFVKEIEFLRLLNELNVTVLDRTNTIDEFSFKYFEKDIYVLFYSYNTKDYSTAYKIEVLKEKEVEYTKYLDNAKNIFRKMIQNREYYGHAIFAAMNYELLNEENKIPKIINSTIHLYREGKIKIKNYDPTQKPDKNKNSDLWTLYYMQEQIKEFQRKNVEFQRKNVEFQRKNAEFEKIIPKLENQISIAIPIGFLYTQLPHQSEPTILWPKTEWTQVTQQYAGLFFRAEGENALPFGQTQTANYSKLIFRSRRKGGVPGTSSSDDISQTFEGQWTRIQDWVFDAFYVYATKVENRPMNTAIRIWKRIK